MGDVVALPGWGSTVLPDARGGRRALQVTWHDDVVVISCWLDGRCTATVRLVPRDAAALIAVLGEGLGVDRRSTRPTSASSPRRAATRPSD